MLCKIINLGKGEGQYFYHSTLYLPFGCMLVYVYLHKYGTFQNDERQLSRLNWQHKQGNMKFQTSYKK